MYRPQKGLLVQHHIDNGDNLLSILNNYNFDKTVFLNEIW